MNTLFYADLINITYIKYKYILPWSFEDRTTVQVPLASSHPVCVEVEYHRHSAQVTLYTLLIIDVLHLWQEMPIPICGIKKT